MPTHFGTDGIRGLANARLGAELAVRAGRAVGIACREGVISSPSARPTVVIGRDTRCSGDLLESALVAGLCSAGAQVVRAGILPTPGVAFLVSDLGAQAGIMVSASHNPPPDNGIKVFGAGGWKPSIDDERRLESLLDDPGALPTGLQVGRVDDLTDAAERYVRHLTATVDADLSGLKVVADCAFGAAWQTAPETLRRLGIDLQVMHAEADGARINVDCGATHPQVVAGAAGSAGAIGLTFDGDADRVLAADEHGDIVDGDAILAVLASHLRGRGELDGEAIVVTVMSNQALRRWCDREGIGLVETPVGDRHVLEQLRGRKLSLGGEQSGHVIRLDRATTGDGILTALGLLQAVRAGGGALSEAVPFRPLPQVLVNVEARTDRLDDAEGVWRAVQAAQQELGPTGRVLVRPSGTEPLVRVMVEAPTSEDARRHAEAIASVIRTDLAGAGGR